MAVDWLNVPTGQDSCCRLEMPRSTSAIGSSDSASHSGSGWPASVRQWTSKDVKLLGACCKLGASVVHCASGNTYNAAHVALAVRQFVHIVQLQGLLLCMVRS